MGLFSFSPNILQIKLTQVCALKWTHTFGRLCLQYMCFKAFDKANPTISATRPNLALD